MIALSAKQWKIVGYCLIGLLLLGAVLFTMDKCGGYFSSRDIDKAKANLNAALANVNAAKDVVVNDRIDEAVVLEQVKQAANDVITASNATDQAKAEANAAVANYIAAKNANRPTGTTEADLDAKMRALEQ